jgi:P-type Mg2+ transporter
MEAADLILLKRELHGVHDVLEGRRTFANIRKYIVDFLTFYVLRAVLNANEALFKTGWFVESLATEVLVVFVIPGRYNPLSSWLHAALAATSIAVVLTALMLTLTRLGHYLGFQPPPAEFLVILAALVAAYLGVVEAAKRMFYRHLGNRPR